MTNWERGLAIGINAFVCGVNVGNLPHSQIPMVMAAMIAMNGAIAVALIVFMKPSTST